MSRPTTTYDTEESENLSWTNWWALGSQRYSSIHIQLSGIAEDFASLTAPILLFFMMHWSLIENQQMKKDFLFLETLPIPFSAAQVPEAAIQHIPHECLNLPQINRHEAFLQYLEEVWTLFAGYPRAPIVHDPCCWKIKRIAYASSIITEPIGELTQI